MGKSPENSYYSDEQIQQEVAESLDVSYQARWNAEEKRQHYEHLVETKTFIEDWLLETIGRKTLDGWIVCGSGLASLPNSSDIEVLTRKPVAEIPNWFVPQAAGHGKELVIANIGGQIVGIATGRAHIYDTNGSPTQLRMITDPLVVAKGLGINWLITTNAAGILDDDKKVGVGDVVVDVDYINQQNINPQIGPNDDRLGSRFPSKTEIANPKMFSRLKHFVPEDKLHMATYILASNTPFYEGGADLRLVKNALHDPNQVLAFGMSFPMDAMTMQHFNDPSIDENGFDRKIPWIGLTAATNIIPQPQTPTKEQLRAAAVPNPNPTSHEEVMQGGATAEKLFIPAVIKLCQSITEKALTA